MRTVVTIFLENQRILFAKGFKNGTGNTKHYPGIADVWR
jgi:hypothetical protein